MEATGKIVHPAVSSVIYLSGSSGDETTGGEDDEQDAAGPTLVLDQRVHDKDLAPRSWLIHPVHNAMLTFPGDRLHGVLPGRPRRVDAPRAAEPGEAEEEEMGLGRTKESERLTLMIAWWSVSTREMLGKGKKRLAIGPQATLPRASRRYTFPEHFTREFHEGSEIMEEQRQGGEEGSGAAKQEELPVVRVDQPWDTLGSTSRGGGGGEDGDEALNVPHHIDQRFFLFDPTSVTKRLFTEHHNDKTTPE